MPMLKMFIAHQIIFQVALQSYFGIFLITMKMQISRSELCSYMNFFFSVFIFGCAGSSLLIRLFSSCGEQGLLFIVVPGLLSFRSSGSREHRLSSVVHGLSLFCGRWNLPRPGIEPVSPALAVSYPLYHQGSPKYKFIIACCPTF